MISTDRTSLVPLSTKDAPFMFELMTSPLYKQFIGDRGLSCVADAEQYIEDYFLHSERTFGFGYFVARNAEQQPIGTVGFMKKEYLQNPDIGFAFLDKYSGDGFASEVSRAVLKYAHDEWKITTVDAVTDSNNIRSQILLERLNFQFTNEIIQPDSKEKLRLYRIRLA